MEQMNSVHYPMEDKKTDQPRTTPLPPHEQKDDSKKVHPHRKDKNQKDGQPDGQKDSNKEEEDSKSTNEAHKSGNSETWKGKCHVLLVDDNKINLNLLTMFMKKCGFSYEEADNGEEAVETFKKSTIGEAKPSDPIKRRFDYILMDISMPVMNGVEATKRIRKLETEYKVPRTTVFALTGLASADARLDAMTAGVDLFLPKPVKFAELKTMIDNN